MILNGNSMNNGIPKQRKWTVEDFGSLIEIEVPYSKFEKYVHYTDGSGHCRLRGSGNMVFFKEIESRPNLMLGLYNLGKDIEKVQKRLGLKGIGIETNPDIYRLVLKWITRNGLPNDAHHEVKLTGLELEKYINDLEIDRKSKVIFFDENYEIEIDKENGFKRNISIDVNNFARDVWKFSDCMDYAVDVKNRTTGYSNGTRYLLGGLDISQHLTDGIPLSVSSEIGAHGGLIPTPIYDKAKETYKILLSAFTHLGAAYAQLSFALIGNIARCSYCGKIFMRESRSTVCSENCKNARASDYVKKTLAKPKENRNQKKTPIAKRKAGES